MSTSIDKTKIELLPVLRKIFPASIVIEKNRNGETEVTLDNGNGKKEKLNITRIEDLLRGIW